MLHVEVIIREGDIVIDHNIHSTDQYCGVSRITPTILQNGDVYLGYSVNLTMDYSGRDKDVKRRLAWKRY